MSSSPKNQSPKCQNRLWRVLEFFESPKRAQKWYPIYNRIGGHGVDFLQRLNIKLYAESNSACYRHLLGNKNVTGKYRKLDLKLSVFSVIFFLDFFTFSALQTTYYKSSCRLLEVSDIFLLSDFLKKIGITLESLVLTFQKTKQK